MTDATDAFTASLIDSLLSTCRLLAMRDLSSPAVAQALIDLRADPDVTKVAKPPVAAGLDAARVAVFHLLRRIQTDPRVAYYFDPLSESFERLTEAHALTHGVNVETYRAELTKSLKVETPVCRFACQKPGT